MAVTASAPGKLLLLGDHAVVYDRPCLVTAVDIRYQASISKQDDSTIEIDTPELRQQAKTYRISAQHPGKHYTKETAFVEAAIAQVFREYDLQSGLSVVTQGPVVSYGLGSSSAITVAAVAALSSLFDLRLDKAELFRVAYAAVLDVQGTGSGFDVASAVYGRTVYFVTGGATIEPLPVDSLPFVIGYSGEKVSTTNLVGEVRKLRERQPAIVNRMFGVSREIVDSGKEQLLNGDWSAFGDLMNLHQGLLDAWGVNTLQLATLIAAARDAGALGAKLSGAGGGDCMFAVGDGEKRVAVEQAVRDAGGEVVDVALNAEGVQLL